MWSGESLDSWAFDCFDEFCHTSDTIDVSRIKAEEDTTERREGAHQVRLPRHGGLDAIDIAGGRERAAGGHADGI